MRQQPRLGRPVGPGQQDTGGWDGVNPVSSQGAGVRTRSKGPLWAEQEGETEANRRQKVSEEWSGRGDTGSDRSGYSVSTGGDENLPKSAAGRLHEAGNTASLKQGAAWKVGYVPTSTQEQ